MNNYPNEYNTQPGMPMQPQMVQPGMPMQPQMVQQGMPMQPQMVQQGMPMQPQMVQQGMPMQPQMVQQGMPMQPQMVQQGMPMQPQMVQQGMPMQPQMIQPGMPMQPQMIQPGMPMQPQMIQPGMPMQPQMVQQGMPMQPQMIQQDPAYLEKMAEYDRACRETQEHTLNVIKHKFALLVFIFSCAEILLLLVIGIIEKIPYVSIPLSIPFIALALEFGITHFTAKSSGGIKFGGLVVGKVFNIIFLVLAAMSVFVILGLAFFGSIILSILGGVLGSAIASSSDVAGFFMGAGFGIASFVILMLPYVCTLVLLISMLSIRSKIKAALRGVTAKGPSTFFAAVLMFLICLPIIGYSIYMVIHSVNWITSRMQMGHAATVILSGFAVLLAGACLAFTGILFILLDNRPNKKLAAYHAAKKAHQQELNGVRESIRSELEKEERAAAKAAKNNKNKDGGAEDNRVKLKINSR